MKEEFDPTSYGDMMVLGCFAMLAIICIPIVIASLPLWALGRFVYFIRARFFVSSPQPGAQA